MYMKLYAKYRLICNDIIKDYCQTIIDEQWDYKTEKIFRIPESAKIIHLLNEEMQKLGLPKIRVVSIFCRGPDNTQIIHRDTNNEDFEICHSGFYIPLLNTGGKLVWFDPDAGFNVKRITPAQTNSTNSTTSVLSVIYDSKQSYVIGEYDGCDPLIVRVSVPHRAESTSHPRAAISIRLTENVDLFEHFNLQMC